MNRLTIHGIHEKINLPLVDFIKTRRSLIQDILDKDCMEVVSRQEGNSNFTLSFVTKEEMNKLLKKLEGASEVFVFKNNNRIYALTFSKDFQVNFKRSKHNGKR